MGASDTENGAKCCIRGSKAARNAEILRFMPSFESGEPAMLVSVGVIPQIMKQRGRTHWNSFC